MKCISLRELSLSSSLSLSLRHCSWLTFGLLAFLAAYAKQSRTSKAKQSQPAKLKPSARTVSQICIRPKLTSTLFKLAISVSNALKNEYCLSVASLFILAFQKAEIALKFEYSLVFASFSSRKKKRYYFSRSCPGIWDNSCLKSTFFHQ
jgi:hypothetical protein